MERQRFKGLRPQTYEHPSDRMALDALSKTKGFDRVVSRLNEWSFDRLLRVQLTGSYLRATADTFPKVHKLLREACQILDCPCLPDLYIAPGLLNAFTSCVSEPLIVLTSSSIDLLNDDELLFVIAHEMGHIKSGHVLYYQMAEIVPNIADMMGAIAGLLGTGIELALLHWKRMSEFTADRAGLLACQDVDIALRTMMKLAGLPVSYYASINTQDFIEQARSFQAMSADKLNLIAKALSTMGETHPWTVMRAQQLLLWAESPAYGQMLEEPGHNPESKSASFCTECGKNLKGARAFCPNCGVPIKLAHTAMQ